MKYRKDVQRTDQVTYAFDCDKCGTRYVAMDVIEMQECVSLGDVGGFGSVWGDGTAWEIDLCQHCVHELLGEYVRITGHYS